jgi:hypothetical protein
MVLKLAHNIDNYSLKRIEMATESEAILRLIESSLDSSLINLRWFSSIESVTRSVTLGTRVISFSVVNCLVPSSRTPDDSSIQTRVARRKLVATNDGCSLVSCREYVRRNPRWSHLVQFLDMIGVSNSSLRVQLMNRCLTFKKRVSLEITVTYLEYELRAHF